LVLPRDLTGGGATTAARDHSITLAINVHRGDDGHIGEAVAKSKYEFLIPTFRSDISKSPAKIPMDAV